MNRINKQMVDSTLTEKEVEKIAEETAKALGSKFSVTKGSVDNRSFSLDYDGVKYDGGSYLIMYNGDIVNVAIMKAPIYYNYKTKKKYEFGGDFQAGVYAGGGGVGLIGNQKRIDMNKNGKIDAEDFKILRSSMNGAWRNERKHVNHNEDYEVRYAKPRTSRTGYKGKRNFANGGLTELKEKVMSYDKPIEYRGNKYATIYGANYRDVAVGTDDGEIYWSSENKDLLNKINKEVFDSKGSVLPHSEREPNIYVLSVELKKIKQKFDDGGSIDAFTIRMVRGTSGKPTEVISDPREVKFATGGGVEFVPVSQKISKKEKDEFLEYIDGFYGKKGIYADDLKGGFSKVELRKAMNTYLKELGSAPTWGYGDSVDRERVRQILQPSYKMFNEGGFMSRLLTRKKDQPKVETINDDIDLKEDSRIRVKSSTFVSKDKEADWMMKKNSSKEARAYAGGGKTETISKKGKGNHKMKATTDLAKKIRKDGEKWTDAIKRASQQLK
jgi:hypothetical protein